MEEVIKKEITEKLVDSEVVVEGGDSKFTVHVISDSFAGKTIIEQHKVIYAILNKYIKTGEIHALTLKTKPKI